MRKLMGLVVVLALAAAAVLILRGRDRPQKQTPVDDPSEETGQTLAATAMKGIVIAPEDLGIMTENTELGGINITVVDEGGGQTVYTFTDVAKDSWYADAVNYTVSAGLMNGLSGTTLFRPEFGLQRESFALILYRFAGGEPTEPRHRFEDVTQGEWYADAVNWTTSRGILSGLSGTSFGVGEYMTCERALVALYHLAGDPKTDGTLENYPYAPKVSESARNAVSWAWNSGLITEIECVWYPTQAISRAQVALLMMRYSTMVERQTA